MWINYKEPHLHLYLSCIMQLAALNINLYFVNVGSCLHPRPLFYFPRWLHFISLQGVNYKRRKHFLSHSVYLSLISAKNLIFVWLILNLPSWELSNLEMELKIVWYLSLSPILPTLISHSPLAPFLSLFTNFQPPFIGYCEIWNEIPFPLSLCPLLPQFPYRFIVNLPS